MLQIEIKNFQSIERETIDIDGFSVLAGKSNIGKSAIVRAIKAALTGAPVDSYVRHSFACLRLIKGNKSCNCFCSVHIKTEGLDLLWEKGDSVNRYIYNGNEYSVAGRGTPDFLRQDFAPVKIGDEKEILQILDQFRPIFILDKPGTVVADVLSDVVKLNQINVATRLVEKDRRDASTTRKVREQDILDLKKELLRYEFLDALLPKMDFIEKCYAQIEDAKRKIAQLEGFLSSLRIIGERVRGLLGVENVRVPDIGNLFKVESLFGGLEQLSYDLMEKTNSVSSLAGVDCVIVPDVNARSMEVFEKLTGWSLTVDFLRDFFNRFGGIPSLPLPVLSFDENRYAQFNVWNSKVSALSTVCMQVGSQLKIATEDLSLVLDEFKRLGICPTCNRSLLENHDISHFE